MKIVVTGVGKKKIKSIQEAMNFYLLRLMPSKKLDGVFVNVVVHQTRKTMGTGYMASVRPISSISKPKRFVVSIYNRMTSDEFFICLAHECVHIKQFLLDNLMLHADTCGYFKNKFYDAGDEPYDILPWEIEAKTKESDLFLEYSEIFQD